MGFFKDKIVELIALISIVIMFVGVLFTIWSPLSEFERYFWTNIFFSSILFVLLFYAYYLIGEIGRDIQEVKKMWKNLKALLYKNKIKLVPIRERKWNVLRTQAMSTRDDVFKISLILKRPRRKKES